MSNDNQPTNEELEQRKLSQVYAKYSNEQPSIQTDAAILALAKSHAKQHLSTPEKHRRQWRKWQWPTSIAASVMFVSVIVYTQYEQFEPQQTPADFIPADSYAIAEQATLDESAARERAVLETKALGSQRRKSSPQQEELLMAPALKDLQQQEITETQTDEPQKSNYAEQEAHGLAAQAMKDVELDINPNAFQIDGLAKIEARLVDKEINLAQELDSNMQPNLNALVDQQTNADDEVEMTEIVVTGSRIQQEPEGESVQSSYLDDVADKLKDLQRLSSPNQQQSLKIASLQSDLVDYVMLLKAINPETQVDQEYLQLLTPAQVEQVTQEK